jgi:hypothetical protein
MAGKNHRMLCTDKGKNYKLHPTPERGVQFVWSARRENQGWGGRGGEAMDDSGSACVLRTSRL